MNDLVSNLRMMAQALRNEKDNWGGRQLEEAAREIEVLRTHVHHTDRPDPNACDICEGVFR